MALSGSDVIGQAKTGTGKTLGFGLPLLERVTVPADVEAGRAKPEDLTEAPQALVVVPTRELCTQVTNDLQTAGKVRNVRVLAIYGGRAYEPQVEALKKGVDVVVGTPGRLLDLAGQKKLDLKHVRSLVLDEADEMLDLGFLPDVEKIINMLPAKRQTMLFSATMPGAVIGLARRYMSQPTHISATSPDDEGKTVANTKQFVYRAHNMDKPEMVARILQAEGRGLAMIFCRTKRTAADIADQLQRRGFAAGAVHGDLGQGAREQALRAFRNGKVDVLVCTDVAARGIDVEGVTHVINYQSPEDEKTFLHRVGRTGRAGAKGTAVTFVDWDDIPRWQLINKALGIGFNDPVETYSTSPHLFSDLNIPEGTKGILPRSERTRAGLGAEEIEDLGEPGGRKGDRDRGGRGGRGRGGRDERPSRDDRDSRDDRGSRDERPSRGEGSGATEVAEGERAPRTPRRRRRTRNGAPVSQAAAAATAAVETPAEAPVQAAAPAAQAAVETAEGTEAAPRRRRRTRAGAGAAEGVVTEAAAQTAPVAEAAPVEPEAAPRRRTRKAAAPAQAEAVADTVEAVEAAPKRRTRKAAAPAETAEVTPVEAPADAEAKPRRRIRKAAAPAQAEAVADTVEAVEAAPKRRPRKAAAPVEAVADTVEAAAEAAPKRRTRKAAAPAETAEVTPVEAPADAEAKPRRRTRKAAAPAQAEAVADTVEAVEAAPRRRTRKTAEAAPVAGIPAQAGEEAQTKPRRRTPRKAAQPAES